MERDMASVAHVRELENKHSKLDAEIQSELKSPASDSLHIATLKKRKLLLKQKISELTS
jgi:hypothetical protein